ncbi:hypothetical protein [Borrelia crocidurae]|uniref:Uncharacterized protein n=1 Tax=Borrelia crocidurae (strain Achema) TaxID=1155096 RepID=I0FE51_BORCA|nr:hypothetical protein [Borrelia crocidurae]AFI31757.1 hypothetical protein Q7M_1049 [Borrelia crocidurae str. Achema]
MQRIYILVFLFGMLMLCCKQWRNDRHNIKGTEETKNKSGSASNFPFSPVISDIGTEKTDGLRPTGVKDLQGNGEVGHVGDEVTETFDSLRTKAYIALRTNLSKLVDLYYYRPSEFSDFLFENIKTEFGVDEMQDFRDSVYAMVKGDVAVLKNLEKIVMHSFGKNEVVSQDYLFESNAYFLLFHFSKMANYLLGIVMHKNGYILNDDNLLKLQDSKDVEGLNELASILEHICLKWENMVRLVKGIINDASRFTTKDEIMERLKPITDLEVIKYNQNCDCNLPDDDMHICKLKNNLRVLCRQLKEKMNKLIRYKDY